MKSRNPWNRSVDKSRYQSEQYKRRMEIAKRKILTISEVVEYLNIDKTLVERLIKNGAIETIQGKGRKRLVSMECLKGLLSPVKSLNKRLQIIEEIKGKSSDNV